MTPTREQIEAAANEWFGRECDIATDANENRGERTFYEDWIPKTTEPILAFQAGALWMQAAMEATIEQRERAAFMAGIKSETTGIDPHYYKDCYNDWKANERKN